MRALNIEVTDEFQAVERAIEDGRPVVFVTGTAGTGKSTLVHYLRAKLNKRMAVVAPTGIAALNAGGQTIHSFFKFPPRPLNLSEIKRVRDPGLYKALELVVIDEVSMVRADLLDYVDRFLRLNARDRNEPFGGVQVLLVGDLYQLPPVVSRKEEAAFLQMNYESRHFFDARCLKGLPITCIELTRVFRQEDPHFLKLLADLRHGEDLPNVVQEFNRLTHPGGPNSEQAIILTSINKTADDINRRKLWKLPDLPTVFDGELEGSFRLGETYFPSPHQLVLKRGARVMFTANDPSYRWVNGTSGVVAKVRDRSVKVAADGGGTCEVEPFTWQQIEYTFDRERNSIDAETVGSYTQLPLRLAWAVTIHKSQGLTLEAAHVDLGRGAFEHGQVHVALSRCKSMAGLSLERPLRLRDIQCDDVVKRFHADNLARH